MLPDDIVITGVEPSADMRAQALRDGTLPFLSFVDDTAERLPCADHSARAVTAATAAHCPSFADDILSSLTI
ncbi:hypothetical protein ACUSIJ_15310 [Pseudochelatococcus sp. B33]